MRSFQFYGQEFTKRIQIAGDAIPDHKMVKTNIPADTGKKQRIIRGRKIDRKTAIHENISFQVKGV